MRAAELLQSSYRSYVDRFFASWETRSIGAVTVHGPSKSPFAPRKGGCPDFCGTGFQPVIGHGQDGRATFGSTEIFTVPRKATNQKPFLPELRL